MKGTVVHAVTGLGTQDLLQKYAKLIPIETGTFASRLRTDTFHPGTCFVL